MKLILIAAVMSTLVVTPGLARDNDDNGHHYGWFRDHDNPHYRGAPGPIAGAGLPILAVGYGVYWVIRRRRKKTD
jgi:hypothetical protein